MSHILQQTLGNPFIAPSSLEKLNEYDVDPDFEIEMISLVEAAEHTLELKTKATKYAARAEVAAPTPQVTKTTKRDTAVIPSGPAKEPWAARIPILPRKEGMNKRWKQLEPCCLCKRDKYNPLWIARHYRQVCKICFENDTQEVKALFA